MEPYAEGMLTPADCKMFVYFGHDSTISNLLSAIKVWDPQIPDYGIMILVERHQNKTGQHGTKVTELTTNTLTLIYLKIS
jgi:prostatic aicd phosphatase